MPHSQKAQAQLFSLDFLNKAQNELNTTTIPVADVLATLTQFTAETIAEAILKVTATQIEKNTATTVYISGGGFHNPLIIKHLEDLLPFQIASTTSLGINGDAKEALLFAILANETICGNLNSSKRNNSIPALSMGKISFPR